MKDLYRAEKQIVKYFPGDNTIRAIGGVRRSWIILMAQVFKVVTQFRAIPETKANILGHSVSVGDRCFEPGELVQVIHRDKGEYGLLVYFSCEGMVYVIDARIFDPSVTEHRQE